jgi:hypothetical protein
MKILNLRIDHQPSIQLRSISSLDQVIINDSNKYLYFKIDSLNPDNLPPNGSYLSQKEYFKIELTTGTYTNNVETKRNDSLSDMINDAIRSSDPYYSSFLIDHKFVYMDEENHMIIRSLIINSYGSVKIFPDFDDSIFLTITFKENYVKGMIKNQFNNYLNDSIIKMSFIAVTSDEGDVNITNDPDLKFFSLDPNNFYIIPNSYDSSTKTIDIKPLKEGSGIIKIIYKKDNENFYLSQQFLCHNNFFKENYLTYFFTPLDANNIATNQFAKSIFDTLMEMIDILYAYNEDLKIISNFREGKSKFISMLAQNVGFERIDFTQFNTQYEWSNNETFRELIANMFDLISVRGTKLAYELFFNALGYITTLQEFWYDNDGSLIEINPEDDSKSTFYAYSTTGALVDNPPYPRPDPRKNNNLLSNDYNNLGNYIRVLNSDGTISYQLKEDISLPIKNNNYDVNVFKNNKSNYMKVIFNNSINDNFFEDPQNFSVEKKIIMRRYLEFLRPSHIQYITETFQEDIPVTVFDVSSILNDQDLGISELREFKDYLSDVLFDQIKGFIEDNDFNVGDVKNNEEELSYSNKWDTLLQFDQTNLFDFKSLVVENLTAQIVS